MSSCFIYSSPGGGLLASCGEGANTVSAVLDPELTGPEWILAAINDKPVADGI